MNTCYLHGYQLRPTCCDDCARLCAEPTLVILPDEPKRLIVLPEDQDRYQITRRFDGRQERVEVLVR